MEEFFMSTYLAVLFPIPSVCFENLTQLAEYSDIPTQSESYRYPDSYLADKAVDGYLEEDYGDNTCSITLANPHIHTAWWKLPLKRQANVAYLRILFRKSTVNRHTGISVFVFNDSSYTPPSSSGDRVYTHDPSTCLHQEMNITVNRVTQGIALYNSKNPPISTICKGYEPSFATIEICEVFVMGCPPQNYGENCTICNLRCRDQLCDAFNGSCKYGCNNTFMTSSDCSCVKGHYGTYCEKICGKCLAGVYCDQYTGICPSRCLENWQGPRCDECKDYKYGPNCVFDCGHCKNNTLCSKIDGTCENGCETEWSGSFCHKVSSANEHTDNWLLKTPTVIILVGSTFFVTLVSIGVTVLYRRIKQKSISKNKEESNRNPVSNNETIQRRCVQNDGTSHNQYYNVSYFSSKGNTNDGTFILENM